MARYLVTGGCGFIGSHLVDALLEQEHQVRVLDDLSTGKLENVPAEGVDIVLGDVADPPTVRRALAGMDGCFHLAAIASVQRANEDWIGAHRVNLTGSIAVLDAARTAHEGEPVPVVYASSAAVYGDNPDMPLAETAETRPMTAYGADKLGSEQHARVAGLVHNVPSTGFRFFNIYGPRQDPSSPYSGVISIFADRLAAGQGVTIFGDGEQTRDFVYVADVVRHLIAGMENASLDAPVFNVCTGRTTSVLQLANTIAELLQTKPEIAFGEPRPGDIRHSLGDPTAASRALGVAAETQLAAGLDHLLASLRTA